MDDFIKEFNLAIDLHKQKKIDDSLKIYQRLLKIKKNDFNLLYLIGIIYLEKKKTNLSILYLEKALNINNQHIGTLNNLGGAYFETNKFKDALKIFQKITLISPDFTPALINKANCLAELKKFDEALLILQKLIKDDPDNYILLNTIGNIFKSKNKEDEAIEYYKKSTEINQNYILPYINLAEIFKQRELLKESLAMCTKAYEIDSEYKNLTEKLLHIKMNVCDWSNYKNLKNKILKNLENNNEIDPFILLSINDNPTIQKKNSETYIKKKFGEFLGPKISMNKNIVKPKIGYFSSDFKDHPVMHLISEVFKNHNKSKFDLVAFSLSTHKEDEWNKDLNKIFKEFINVENLPDEEIAALSRKMKIDIAVDLNGYTKNSRVGIFFHQAAPIQINFLGYPGTMGTKFIDYIIADEIIIPKNNKINFTEKVIYQKNCFQPNILNKKISSNNFKRSDFGLPEDAFIYCSFNNNYKITPTIFDIWIEILKKVPSSVLWLQCNKIAKKNIEIEIQKRGLKKERIIFAEWLLKDEDHLKRLQLADLFLDTFPYNAHTTASDSIRVGLPILTLQGESYASRVTSSILSQVDMTELIALNFEKYIEIAVDLGNEKNKLYLIKKKLSKNLNKTLLFNSYDFTKNLENIYNNLLKK